MLYQLSYASYCLQGLTPLTPSILPHANSPQQFIEDRKFLRNVTPTTLNWYEQMFKHFAGCEAREDYRQRIIELMQRGVSATSINTWIRGINAFLHWKGTDGSGLKCSPACTHLKLMKLKEPVKILATLTPAQVTTILTSKQKSLNNQRIQVLAVLLLDTGLRIAEALALKRADIDLDNLLVTVMGKGRKERRVPLSLEGRRWLYTWLRTTTGDYVFSTSTGTPLSVRNAQRDLATLCKSVGIKGVRCSPHTLRHTFAVTYLRKGGNLEYLRRILGHSSILITQRYLQSLQPEDLGKVHNGLSPLG